MVCDLETSYSVYNNYHRVISDSTPTMHALLQTRKKSIQHHVLPCTESSPQTLVASNTILASQCKFKATKEELQIPLPDIKERKKMKSQISDHRERRVVLM